MLKLSWKYLQTSTLTKMEQIVSIQTIRNDNKKRHQYLVPALWWMCRRLFCKSIVLTSVRKKRILTILNRWKVLVNICIHLPQPTTNFDSYALWLPQRAKHVLTNNERHTIISWMEIRTRIFWQYFDCFQNTKKFIEHSCSLLPYGKNVEMPLKLKKFWFSSKTVDYLGQVIRTKRL